jgi:hypothetical protein
MFLSSTKFPPHPVMPDTLSGTMTFAKGVKIENVKFVKTTNESQSGVVSFKIVSPISATVIPYEFNPDHRAAANTKIIKIGGETLSVATSSLIQGNLGLATDPMFNAGKQSPVFNRSGVFIGFVEAEAINSFESSWLALMGL